MNKTFGLMALVVVLVLPGKADAGPIYSWSWSNGGPGVFSNNAGRINWVDSQFDTNTNRLRWTANFGQAISTLRTDGFTLALTGGPVPNGAEGQIALLYFDGEDAWTGNGPAQLTAYGYNGVDAQSSHYDGSSQSGMQTPDRILSTRVAAPIDWLYDLSADTEADGTRTMSFDIDVSPLVAHTPQHVSPFGSPWSGIGYGENIGVWMHTFSSLVTHYDGDYLQTWNNRRHGYLDAANLATTVTEPVTEPVPEPGSLALLGLGLGFVGAQIRRRKRS